MEKRTLCCCGNNSVLFAFYHVDDFPRTILRAQLAADAHFLVNDDDAVDISMAVVVGIFRSGNFVEAINGAELNADFTACTSFRMNNRNQRRFFFLLR